MGWQDDPVVPGDPWQNDPVIGSTPTEKTAEAAPQYMTGIEAVKELPQAAAQGVRAVVQNSLAGLAGGLVNATTPNYISGAKPRFGNITGEDVRQALSYIPTNPHTRQALDIISAPGRLYGGMAKSAGESAAEATGSPMAGEMVEKSINIAPFAFGRVPGSPAIAAAKRAGFRLTPAEGEGGPISRLAAGISGEARLARKISEKNWPLIQEKIASDFGLPKGVPIDLDVVRGVRKEAGAGYEAVRNTGRVVSDAEVINGLESLAKPYIKHAKAFPRGARKDVINDLLGSRTPIADAGSVVDQIGLLREKSTGAYRSGSGTVGKTYKDAAKLLEDWLERHIVNTGQSPEIIDAFRQSRQTIAKTYDLENALNAATGEVRASFYGAKAKKGKPLSGGSQEVGQAAAAFPRSTQNKPLYGTGPSYGDVLLGAMQSIANPASLGSDWLLSLLTVGARPAIRSLISSRLGQTMMGRPAIGPGIAPGVVMPRKEE